jgi:transcription elongation factor Elf1
MGMSHRKYKREEKAKEDKYQTMLNPKSPSFIKEKQQQKVEVTVKYTGEYRCPFCLHLDKINAYLISTKKGYHHGLGKCPECGNQMQLKSLTAQWTPEQFADFMYEYSRQGGWQKVPFMKFNERLKLIGWAERFWSRYKQLKGDSTDEKYTDYIQRVQEEQAREQGLID